MATNWKKDSLRNHSIKIFLIGFIPGPIALFFQDIFRMIGSSGGGFPAVIIPGMVFGALFCAGLASIEAFYYRFWKRKIRAAYAGALAGLLIGGIIGLIYLLAGGNIQQQGSNTLQLGLTILLLSLLAFAGGWSSGFGAFLPAGNLKKAFPGLVTGLILAIPLTLVLGILPEHPVSSAIILGVWGGLNAILNFLWESKNTKHWIRILNGNLEDQYFPLSDSEITLGKQQKNTIPLEGYHEIFPYHCKIEGQEDSYTVMDNQEGGLVFVNFRQVTEHKLKHGDLIKIGTALLQYGESK